MFIYLLSFIFLTLPLSVTSLFPQYDIYINTIKIVLCLILMLHFLLLLKAKKITLNKLCMTFIVYILYLLVVTSINGISLSTIFKTYFINFAAILLIQILSLEENKPILKKIYNYNSILIVLNLLLIIIDKLFYSGSLNPDYTNYLLGSDNRFILYFLLQFVLIYNLFDKSKIKKQLIIWYVIGILTLLIVWSASALVVLIGMFVVNMLLFDYKKKLNTKLFLIVVLLLSIGFVFFNIQSSASNFITNVLHKDITLSYRTNIWTTANRFIFNSPVSFMFGSGFYDLTKTLRIPITNVHGVSFILSPLHMHNLIENLLYSGGLVGLLLYLKMYFDIFSKSNKIKKEDYFNYNSLSLIIIALQALMMFDVFEYYAIYFMIIALINESVKKLKKEAMVE